MSRRTGKPSYNAATQESGGGRVPRVWQAIAGLAVAAVIGVFIGVQVAGPSAAETSVAELRKQEAQRDTEQIKELTARARQTVTALQPILDGLAKGAPAATETQVAQWKKAIAAEVEFFSVTVSGTTATNVARGGLRVAVNQLAAAVDSYAAGQQAQASRQRDLAVASWSVAATQLDQINVDAGNGHQHVYLNTTGVDGAMHADGTEKDGAQK